MIISISNPTFANNENSNNDKSNCKYLLDKEEQR